ncbi:hypothetical protein [Nocardioides alcanivorans]|uniref:hypothetical protein n=1 Tax=Nocardioides alcanivorans TaxID=2897352 RepID=UPI001F3498DB|nr:hypothetical protein [Nocardioides alcanivorans]
MVRLTVPFTPPPGQKVDERFGAATHLVVTATPSALIRSGDGHGTDLARVLELDPAVGEGILHVAARAASCDIGDGEGAACRMHQQDWGVPLRVVADGSGVLSLPSGAPPTDTPTVIGHPKMGIVPNRFVDSGRKLQIC